MRHKGMRVRRFLTVFAALAVAGVVMAACASPSTPNDGTAGTSAAPSGSATPTTPPSPSDSASPDDGKVMPGYAKQVIVTKTGGFVGINQRIVIAEDGAWTFTNEQTTTTEQGKLSAEQLRRLQAIATSEGLFAPPVKDGPDQHCADMYMYEVMVGDMSTATDDCGQDPNDTFTALVALVRDATPLG